MLIHHGRADNLIPIQAAKEHARLVPQAELELFRWRPPRCDFKSDALCGPGSPISLLVLRRGEATLRAEASAERINAADQPFVRDRSWHYEGLALFIVISLLMAATMVSEDLTCIGGGLLAANGLISLPAAVIACFLGHLYWRSTALHGGEISGSERAFSETNALVRSPRG